METMNSNFKSAGDMMRAMGMPHKPSDFITGKVISRSRLNGNSKYSYCPYCYQRIKRAKMDYKKELQPLMVVIYKNLYRIGANGEAMIIIEKEYECPVCRMGNQPRKITADDFLSVFATVEESRSPYLNLNDVNALRREGFDEYAQYGDM